MQRRRDAAEADLLVASGGRATCRIPAAAAPLVKAPEGRVAALAEATRSIRSLDLPTSSAAVADLTARWRRALATAESLGNAWLAYRAAGVHELDRLHAELEAAADEETRRPSNG